MMPRAGSAVSRAAAVVLLLLPPLAVWFGGIRPLINGHAATRLELQKLSMAKSRLLEVIETARVVRSNPQGTEAYQGDAYSGESEPALVAELQKQLGTIAQAAGVEVISAQAVPTKQSSAPNGIGVRIQLRGSIDKIQRIVHAVEAARPFLFIEKGGVAG